MIPVSLRLRNFMSYGEAVPPLDFSQLNTACLTGDNGHGKSSLLDAITWSLWGQTRAKNLDDIVRLGQEEAEVEFVFDLEGAQYRVIRKRSLRTKTGHSSLELQGFDPLTHQFRSISGNSIRETETKIVQLLHMTYDTFINSVFVLQGRADEFTTRRPGERKRILAEILGLAVFDELEARAREYRGTLDHDVKTLQQRMAELQHEVARKDELAAAVSAHQETLLQLQTDIQIEQQRLEQLRQEQNALGLQSQRAQEAERRLQDVQRAYADIDRQLALHQRQAAAYETVLQQETAIQAGYDSLQRLKDEEQRENAKAEVYAGLQQRQSELQQAITAAQHHLELERSSAQQRLQDTHSALQACDTILQDAPRITASYDALKLARQQETAMAQRLQRRYTLEQEKTQVERRIQQKRHALELEQRTLVARQQEWQQKESHLPTWQQQMGTVRQQLAQMEQQAKRFDQVRTEGVELKVRIETSLPQTLQTLQQEIDQQHEKQHLLAAAGAHCPLCERTLSEADRRRVLQNLANHISGYETRMHQLQGELRQLEQQRRQLRTEYKTLEQHLEQRQTLEQQYATLQVSLDAARGARENLVALAETLQLLDEQLAAGTYAAEELDHLQKLTAELDGLAYDQQEHEAVKQQLVALTSAELDWQRLQQAMVDQTHLSERQKALQQNVAMLEQTLAKQQFAVTEQQELSDVVARLAHLNFNPVTYNLLRQRLQAHQHFERQHIELETARQQLTQARALLQDLEARKQRYEAELRSIAAERQQLLQGLDALEQLRTDRARTEALLQNLQHREGEARLALGRSQSHYEHCLQRETELREKTQQHAQCVEERTLYGDLVNLFGKNGIQAIIIENAIPELEDEANRILSRISDNAMHLTLETQRDTRAGGVVETLDIKISDTLGTRNYELFSGGEAFRINFALRIALSKMLARRAGARLRTLVIDEGFGTQDTQGLERLVEIIKAIRHDFDKIIIITHLRELKNAFDTYIEVKKDPLQGSSYQVF